MPLPAPPLDTRRYEDIVRETLARVPVHTPEWTNFNDSDPGVTLVQLFAFLTESLLYRVNQIPDRNYAKFLDLLQIGLATAQPARGLLTVANTAPGAPATVNLPSGFEVRAGQVPFRAERGLDVLPLEIAVCFKRRIAADPALIQYYQLLYASWKDPASAAELQPDLYETVILDGDRVASVDVKQDTVDGFLWVALLARATDKPGPGQTWDDVLPIVRKAIANRILSLGFVPSEQVTMVDMPPVGVSATGGQPPITYSLPSVPAGGNLPDDPALRVAAYRQIPAQPQEDVTARPGIVELALPADDKLTLWNNLDPLELGADNFPPLLADTNDQARLVTWIRVEPSVASGAVFSWAGGNATSVTQKIRVSGERLAPGTGQSDQVRVLAKTPVVSGSVAVQVGSDAPWTEIADLYDAPPETAPGALPHVFHLDAESGTITFGDGLHGKRPPNGAILSATYDYCAGAGGMVGKGAINSGPGLPAGFKVSNPVPTWGGTDAETVDEGKKQITRYLQHRDRLVIAEDFKVIARRTPGVTIGRVDVLSAFHPDLSPNEPGDAPGVVTLMLIPLNDPQHPDAPEPDRMFLDAVCDYLDDRRLVTTELVLRGPNYRDVWISAGVNAVAGANADEVCQAVTAALKTYLAPVRDSALPDVTPVASTAGQAQQEGWPLRRAVTGKELIAEAARVPGVLSVNDVLLAENGASATDEVAMRGLDLPRIAGLSVTIGDPAAIESLRGETPAAPPPVRRLPVPAIAESC